MKVKIGNKIYDPNAEPIMLIFKSQKERKGFVEQIKNMAPDATKYCQYPAGKEWSKNNYKKIKEWMKT